MFRRPLHSAPGTEAAIGWNPYRGQFWGYVATDPTPGGPRHFLVDVEDPNPQPVITALSPHVTIPEGLEAELRADADQHGIVKLPGIGTDPPLSTTEPDLPWPDPTASAGDTELGLS